MWLLVLKRSGEVSWTRLTEGYTRVGRGSDNDLVLVGRGVSRHHALFHLDGEVLTVKDLDSTYGTRVCSTLVREKVVEVGDPIDIGVFRLVLLPDEAHSAEGPTADRIDEQGFMSAETGEYTMPGFEGRRVVMGPPSGNEPTWQESSDVGILAPARGVALVDEWRSEALARVLRRRPVSLEAAWEERALAFLQDIARRAAVAREAGSTLKRTAQGLAELLRCDLVVVLEVTGEGAYQPLAVHRAGQAGQETPLSRTVVNRAVRERSPVVSENLATDPEFRAMDSAHIAKVGAIVAMPMLVGEEVVGVLYVSREAGAVFSDEEIQLAEVAASVGAGVIRVHHLVRELRDRRKLDAALERVADPEVRRRLFGGQDLLGLQEVQPSVLAVRIVEQSLWNRSPGEVSGLTTELLGAVDDAVARNGGRVVAFGAGWALALFGVPKAARTDASWAVAAGLEVWGYVEAALKERWGGSLLVGVGLDTGRALWGVVGWPGRALQVALGPAVQRALAVAEAHAGRGPVVTEAVLNLVPTPGFRAEPASAVEESRVFLVRPR